MVYFAENYTLQPHNEIKSEYYHSNHVNIMVHMTYKHRADGTEDNMVILKDYYSYISDDKCNDLDFIEHKFHLFYNHLKDTNIRM